jgi:hypothetical protein
LEFVGNSCKHSAVAFVVSKATIPQAKCSPIGDVSNKSPRIMHACLSNATNHDGLGGIPSPQVLHPTSHSVQRHFRELIAAGLKFRVRVPAEGDARHAESAIAHALSHQ